MSQTAIVPGNTRLARLAVRVPANPAACALKDSLIAAGLPLSAEAVCQWCDTKAWVDIYANTANTNKLALRAAKESLRLAGWHCVALRVHHGWNIRLQVEAR